MLRREAKHLGRALRELGVGLVQHGVLIVGRPGAHLFQQALARGHHMLEVRRLAGEAVAVDRVGPVGAAEEVGRMPLHRERYEIAIARAVAQAPVLAEYLLPLVKVGGRCLMQKGARAPEEIQEAGRIIRLCGGELSDLLRLSFEGIEGEGSLAIINKTRPTPGEFPRAVGVPAKKPILGSDGGK